MIMGKLHVVLLEPEIPQNTGNIARTCAAIGATLHLIEPLGFTITDAKLKRAGLDYWDKLDIHTYRDIEDFDQRNPKAEVFYFTTKAPRCFTDPVYPDNCYLMFGKETAGIPEPVLLEHLDQCVRIPMRDSLRSLNLSNSVAVAVYEVLRQGGFASLKREGKFADSVDGGCLDVPSEA